MVLNFFSTKVIYVFIPLCIKLLELRLLKGFPLLVWRELELFNHISWTWLMCCISVSAHFQRVPLAPTRCPPGSRSVSPAQPTASQRRKDPCRACARRTTSGPPWTLPQRRAHVNTIILFICMCGDLWVPAITHSCAVSFHRDIFALSHYPSHP